MIALGAAAVFGAAAAQPLGPQGHALVWCGLAIATAAFTIARAWPPLIRALVAAALVGGFASATVHQALTPRIVATHTQRWRCTVLGDVQPSFGSSSFRCQLDGGPQLLVTASGSAPGIAQHLLLRGRLEPFDEARNPGEPSERAIENERGLAARIDGAKILGVLAPAPPSLAIAIARTHAWALDRLRERLQEPEASILAGELWGERGTLPPALRAEFQETGTVHVLVTAGLHLGVVAMLVTLLLRKIGAARLPSCVIVAATVWGYALFSGSHLPSLRAAIMVSAALAARATGRATLSFDTLALAALGIAFFDPLAVPTASFALSFSCVGAIALCARPLETAIERIGELPQRGREAIVLTLATQLGTWPVTARVFLLFAPYALLANLAVVPVVGATMLLGIAQLALSPVAPLAQAAANLDGWLLAWIVSCVNAIAALPLAKIPATPPEVWAIAGYDAALLGAVWLWSRSARTAALVLFCSGVALVVAPPQRIDTRLHITIIDVGQADAILVQTPLRHAILVDAGGRLERGPQSVGGSVAERVGERIVVPYLLRNGVHHLVALVLSHPHGDHAGGVAPVLRTVGVSELADSGQRYGGSAYKDAVATARSRRVSIVYPRAGAVWKTDDGVTLRFLGPSLPFITSSRNDINNNSIAFILEYRHFRMLFTGDAGVEAEGRFLNEGIDLHADVLKVGHHGSSYSSSPAFIAAVHPRYAIISVGRHNLFGHPAPQTLATLRRFGARIYRTDQNGAVLVTTDGRSEKLSTMLP